MPRYKSRVQVSIGGHHYQRRITQKNVLNWWQWTAKGWQMVRDGQLFEQLEKRWKSGDYE